MNRKKVVYKFGENRIEGRQDVEINKKDMGY